MVTEGDQTVGGEHTMQYVDTMLQNSTHETCIMSLTDIIPQN